MQAYKTTASRIVYRNRWMTVREDKIIRPSGNHGIYGVIEKPHFAVVIPYAQGHIYCVEQYRYPIDAHSIEFPQGAWESNPDADPLKLAAGELKEETGLIAGTMQYVGFQYLAAGYSSQGYHIYLATDLTQSSTQFDIEEEGLVTRKYALSKFESMILNGQIKDATTTNSYGIAKLKGFL